MPALLVLLAPGCSRSSAAATDPLAALTLDEGKRWQSDDHTRKSIGAMREAVSRAAGDSSAARTIVLGKQLQGIGAALVQGCTMTGPTHDALHHYLGVLLPGLQQMTDERPEQARQARAEVTRVLERFADFFQ